MVEKQAAPETIGAKVDVPEKNCLRQAADLQENFTSKVAWNLEFGGVREENLLRDLSTVDNERWRIALEMYQIEKKANFPDVVDISGDRLLSLMQRDDFRDTVVLVDCRSNAERMVSMYKGAVTKEEFEANIDKFKAKLIVPYCAIGRRSGLFAKELVEMHPGMNVRNHAGSLVDWAHVGGLLVDRVSGEPTRRVHSNGKWTPYMPLGKGHEILQ